MATRIKKQDITAEANGAALTPNGHTPVGTSLPSDGGEGTEAAGTHPWTSSAGIFADDPFWEEMMESIARHRREMDAEYQETE